MKGARRSDTSENIIVLRARREKPAASHELALRALAIAAIVVSILTVVNHLSKAIAGLEVSERGVRTAYLSML